MPKTCRLTDRTACTCAIIDGSPDVFVNGLKRARISDPTIGHSSWNPNNVLTGSGSVYDHNLGGTRLGDLHVGHASPTPHPFHQTNYVTGSPDHYTD